LKDAPKSISEKATRFLAVDMKDRLKSAFNRNSSAPPPASENPRADDIPDYSAIFAHRAQTAPMKAPLGDALDQAQLAEPAASVTMRNPARQIAHDIEEAQIVSEPHEDAAASPAWEAVSLKTRKVEAVPEARRAAIPEIASTAASNITPNIKKDAPDHRAAFKSSNSTTAGSKISRPSPGASAIDSATMARPVAPESTPISREDAAPQPKADARPPASEATFSKHEEPAVAQKTKFRFFNDSAESVRLKVEKRPEEHAAPEPAPIQAAVQPAHPEPDPMEVKAQSMETNATGIAREPESVELSKGAGEAMNEAAAVVPATSEQPNFRLQKETASMDAKGHETDNGAAVKADGNAAGAAIAIERNSKFSGQLKFSGAIAIDGQVDGELVAERIVVHEGGVVNATVEGNTVVIAGTVKGDIYARNELEILPSGVVHGSVTAPAINVRRGGRVEGRCAIGVPRP